MRRIQTFAAALVVSSLVASGMVAFSVPVNAWDGDGASNTRICRLLAAAESAISQWPDSSLKTYLLAEIDEAQAHFGCS